MAHAVQRKRVETFLASNPRSGLHKITSVLKVLVIIVGVIFSRCPICVMTRDREVDRVVLLYLRWRTPRSRAALGHMIGSLEALWPIFSPLTLLFLVVRVVITNVVS